MVFTFPKVYLSILCLSGCYAVCLYPINLKTAEPIGLKFFVGPHMTPRKVYICLKFSKLSCEKFDFHEILKIHDPR